MVRQPHQPAQQKRGSRRSHKLPSEAGRPLARTPRENVELKAATLAAQQEIGRHLRWLREAFEARQPGKHSQGRWAEALRISPEMMNRIELGRTAPTLGALQRVIFFTGVSPWYVLFGVVGDGSMPLWLEQDLREKHGIHLSEYAKWAHDRSMKLGSVEALGDRPASRGSGNWRNPSSSS